MANKLSIVVGLLFFACGQPQSNAPPPVDSATFNASAVELSNQFVGNGFDCVAKGRELYPLVYSCMGPDSISSFIYADDRAQIEGIRLFGPEASRHVWMHDFLLQVFSDSTASRVMSALDSTHRSDTEFRLHSFIFELDLEDNRAIFRVSPTTAIQSDG